MAISKLSAKSESWTIRIPNDLAKLVRERFPANTGNTDIVLESLKALLGIDGNLSDVMPNSDLQNELKEIRFRLEALESKISENRAKTRVDIPTAINIDHDWTNLKTVADHLQVLPKSISGAFVKRSKDIGNGIAEISIAGQTIQKQGSGSKAKYKIILVAQ
jgi:hypothetical protein